MRPPLLFSALLILAASAGLRAEPPIPLRQAAEIADKARGDRPGGESVYVQSLSFDRGSLFGGKTVWIAKWSAPLPANDPRNREIGIEIAMDGTVKRIVKEPVGAKGARR